MVYSHETRVGMGSIIALKEAIDDYVRVHTVRGEFKGDPVIINKLAELSQLLKSDAL